MSSDLLIPVDGGCPVLQVHSLQNRVFSIFFLDFQHGFLHFPLFFQFLLFLILLLFQQAVVGKKIQLFVSLFCSIGISSVTWVAVRVSRRTRSSGFTIRAYKSVTAAMIWLEEDVCRGRFTVPWA